MNCTKAIIYLVLVALCITVAESIDAASCGKTEVFVEGCAKTCERKCIKNAYDEPCLPACGPPRCECANFAVRLNNGSCVAEWQCEEIDCYKPHEELKKCGPKCEPVCNSAPDEHCTTSSSTGLLCQCRDGFIRFHDACIPHDECPAIPDCGANAWFRTCGRGGPIPANAEELAKDDSCWLTCDKPWPSAKCLARKGCNPTCGCLAGFIRNRENKCVRLEECPTDSATYICAKMECPNGTQCILGNGTSPAQCLEGPTCAGVKCGKLLTCALQYRKECTTPSCFRHPVCI